MKNFSISSGAFPVQLLVTAALLLPVTAAFAIEDCELNKESVNPANGSTTAGKTGIMKCVDRNSGKLVREQELQAGVFMGVRRYYKDGVLTKEVNVNERGNMHGRSREFAPNGQVLRDETYVNSNVRGLVREWHPNGAVKRIAFIGENPNEKAAVKYTSDKQLSDIECADKPLLAPHANDAALCGFNGKPSQVQLYAENGRLRSQFTLLAGVRQQSTYFHDNGKPETVEESGSKQKTRKQYSDTGILRKETVWNMIEKTAVIEREVEYHESGAKVREQLYTLTEKDGRRQNRLVSDASFYLNGQPRRSEKFLIEGKNDIKEVRNYFDNGQMSSLERYVSEGRYLERPVGIHQGFAQNGKLVRESHYDERGRIQRERSWDENGKQLSDDQVYEDGSRKAFSK
ncbi:hypothetical protein H8L32_12915 [Undibacterium sp. CY18W]|uniref:Antitoxin component YwqK of the YwqJK toxin-antitoxin module n=1 Tax=Undibacterium hunanense TaxID=2762292 RepID=A0ABR6ZR88_9BURK|nr:hypothetical protein [Undibacterium hunanense]MBC3918386.1 hypothetical protein [Undibacterium hunanense]